MGLTYTVCYCRDGYKCKGLKHEQEKFDSKHWQETVTNLRGYLAEPICVPGSHSKVSIAAIEAIANAFSVAVSNCREDRNSNDYKKWHEKRLRCFQLLAELNRIPLTIIDSRDNSPLTAAESTVALIADTDNVSASIVEVADILAQAYCRAVLELIYSVEGSDPVYVYHHLGLVMDIVAEMHGIVIQATAHVSTENMFPEDHQYQELIEERRKADGISP